MDHLTEQDAGLLEQAASMLEGLANDERNRGNCSGSEGAACSAHAIRRLAPAMLRAGHGCLAQIEEPASREHEYARMEAERNDSLDRYRFVSEVSRTEAKAFEAGFSSGWSRRGDGAAPAAVAPRGEYPHEQMDAMALDRYKVVPSNASMLWSHAVVAGDGTQQLYVGREVECRNMARKFAGAFLDGAFAFHSTAAAPTAPAAPALEAPAAPAGDLALIIAALEHGQPQMAHYAEPCERHAKALAAARRMAAAPQAPAEAQEPAANLHDDGYWTPTKTEAGRALNERLMRAGSPRIPVYTHPAPRQAAPQAPNCTPCSGSGEDPEGYLTHGRGPDDHTVDGPCRSCDGTGAAPQAPAAPILSAEPLPVMPRAITSGLGLDDSGEEPAYCVMAAFRSEDDARYALSILSAGLGATAAPAAPAVDAQAHAETLKKAARYDFLRGSNVANGTVLAEHFGGSRMQDFDAVIDAKIAARAAQAKEGGAPVADAAPLDVCTDPYNCARCKTHPAHRGDMHHAGISRIGGSA